MSDWICTDPDDCQWQRKVAEGVYEMYQVGGCDHQYHIMHDFIDMSDYTADEIKKMQDYYGFADEDEANDEGILAECFFECGDWTSISFATIEECDQYIFDRINS